MPLQEIAFYGLSALILALSLGVVVAESPIYGALCLVMALLGVAGIFALLGAHFLAVAQIAVYAGAIVVLFLFVLMLLNVKREQYDRRMLFLAFPAVAASSAFVVMLAPAFVTAFKAGAAAAPLGTVEELGRLLFGKYLAVFEAASMLLMAALTAAVALASRSLHRRER